MNILEKILGVLYNILKGFLLWFTAFITIVWLCSVGDILNSGEYLLLGIMFFELGVLYFLCRIMLDKEDLLRYSGYHLFNRLLHLKDDIDEEDSTEDDVVDKE